MMQDNKEIEILRYYDYGMVLPSMPNEMGIVKDKMYFCFFELNNGKTICVHTYKSFNENTRTYEWNEFCSVDECGNDVIVGFYNITCTECYNFGEDFFSWHERSMKIPNKVIKWPTNKEEEVVINFYEKNLKKLY